MKTMDHVCFDMLIHVVWITRRRKKIITNEMRPLIKQTIEATANYYNTIATALAIEADHVHVLLRIAPVTNIPKLVGAIKAYCSRAIHIEFPQYRHPTRGDNTIWGRGYYVSTVGRLNEADARDYFDQHADVLQWIE